MRRRNPSPGGGKSAALGVDRILQRIVDSKFTAGFERPTETPALPEVGELEVGRTALLVLL
jgi:hypothetical protein